MVLGETVCKIQHIILYELKCTCFDIFYIMWLNYKCVCVFKKRVICNQWFEVGITCNVFAYQYFNQNKPLIDGNQWSNSWCAAVVPHITLIPAPHPHWIWRPYYVSILKWTRGSGYRVTILFHSSRYYIHTGAIIHESPQCLPVHSCYHLHPSLFIFNHVHLDL